MRMNAEYITLHQHLQLNIVADSGMKYNNVLPQSWNLCRKTLLDILNRCDQYKLQYSDL